MTTADRRPGAGSHRADGTGRALELVTERLRIVAEPTRVRILRELDRDGGATVQEVCDAIGVAHQNVSKHLMVLYGAGLLSRMREGRSTRYVLRDWTMLWVVDKVAESVAAQLEEDHDEFAGV